MEWGGVGKWALGFHGDVTQQTAHWAAERAWLGRHGTSFSCELCCMCQSGLAAICLAATAPCMQVEVNPQVSWLKLCAHGLCGCTD